MSPATRQPSTRKHWLPGVWPGRVQQLDRDLADHHDVAAARGRRGRRRSTPVTFVTQLGLVGLHVDRHAGGVEQLGDALDPIAHHGAAAVVGVVVGDERTGEVHAVRGRARRGCPATS